MRILPIAVSSVGLLLTAALLPMTYKIAALNGRDGRPAGFGIVVLCGLRLLVLIAAFLLLMKQGRMEGWRAGRTVPQGVFSAAQVLWVIVGVLALEAGSCVTHFLSIDRQLTHPFPTIFGILATLLPLLAIAGGFLSSRILFTACAGFALAAGLLSIVFYSRLTAPWREARMKEQQNLEELSARRKAELARVPEEAGAGALAAFTGPFEPWEVRHVAMTRIQKNPAAAEELSRMLDGAGRLNALYVLTTLLSGLAEPVRERCWVTTGAIAKDMLVRMERNDVPSRDEIEKLYQSTIALGGDSGPRRNRHQPELAAVRDAVREAERKGVNCEGTAQLDFLLKTPPKPN